ncbi:MAG TPA: hypothetical protein VJR89_10740 [Polyangiales bacterium]|nr:hypothetical protein [Polyangiales bacterium]
MVLRACLVLALTVCVAACGRIGVELRAVDAGQDASPREAGLDAEASGGGQLTENVPTVRDAGMMPQDAAADASPADAARDADVDASLDAGAAEGGAMDAAMDASLDASLDASQDAGLDAGSDAATAPACNGERVFGLCWYLAKANLSCSQECSSRGGFDARALEYIGTPTQGGSVEECSEILAALGKAATVVAAMRSDRYGFGCHVWSETDSYWLVAPAFSASTAAPSGTPVRIACACMR